MEKQNNILKIIFGIIILLFVLFYAISQPSDPFQILALLGAMSWLGILSNIIIRLITKPALEIISDKEIEIGYTTYGPIFNLLLAFISSNKDSLIKNVELTITHENKDVHSLSWEWFEETLHETALLETNVPTRKHKKAIALKVDEKSMVEIKIGFQHKLFKNESYRLLKKINQKYINIVIEGKGKPTELRKTDEYNELISLFADSFVWKVGKYTTAIKVFILGRKKPFIHHFNFELTSLDISTIFSNIETCKLIVEGEFRVVEHESYPPWRWINKNRLTMNEQL